LECGAAPPHSKAGHVVRDIVDDDSSWSKDR
jgi:hypothetical protein